MFIEICMTLDQANSLKNSAKNDNFHTYSLLEFSKLCDGRSILYGRIIWRKTLIEQAHTHVPTIVQKQ